MGMDIGQAEQSSAITLHTAPKTNIEASDDADGEERQQTLSGLFNTDNCAHLGTGLMSGAGNVIKGVGLGVANFIAAPITGAINEGPSGAAKGVGVGVASLVALPIAGVVTGVSQVYKGAKNTKKSWNQNRETMKFNPKTNDWEPKHKALDVALEEAKQAHQKYLKEKERQSSKKSSPNRPNVKVADTSYYDALGVSPNATQIEIRKAYYQLARENHPDKVKDEDAKERFQRIGEAYQVLSNADTRAHYDKYGEGGTEKFEFVDHSLFFALVFGSEDMRPFVGELHLGTMLDSTEFDDLDMSLRPDPRIAELREITLAIQLRSFLADGVEYKAKGLQYKSWLEKWDAKASGLCEKSFGWQMVDAVGFGYEDYANHFLAKFGHWRDKFVSKFHFEDRRRKINNVGLALKTVYKANLAHKKAEVARQQAGKSGNGDYGNQEEASKHMEESMRLSLETMLYICLYDVQITVRGAAKKYLRDTSISEKEQIIRAEVLRDVGRIFLQSSERYAKEHRHENANDVNKTIQNALIQMAQRMDEKTES